MNNTRPISLAFYSLLFCALITGCSGVSNSVTKIMGEDPPKVVIRIEAGSNINPDMMGRASPVVLRIYELKSDDIFNNADFFALYDNDAAILGGDMAARDEMEIPPGEKVGIEKELDMEVRYIGVMAAYRDLDNAVWRGSILTPIDETTYIDVSVGQISLSVKEGEKEGGFLGF